MFKPYFMIFESRLIADSVQDFFSVLVSLEVVEYDGNDTKGSPE